MSRTTQIYNQAVQLLPAGVNSPVRAFKAVGGNPIFAKRGKGPYFWDEEGKRYIDFCASWGALLFGHAPAGLVSAVKTALPHGTSFGIATHKEVELAKAIQSLYPSMEMLRLVSSGTEAVMSAVRLARGYTGRTKILKIDGGYHGHVDSLLVKAGSGAATFGIPDSAGIPESLARETISIPFNDFDALETIFKKEGGHLAAFILEPVPANMGVIPPLAGYLERCRELTHQYGALLIMDEVITGFRVHAGGAQAFYSICPDLTTMGKILGGGFPIAAFGGRKQIMEKIAPLGPVYQAGTLSGNPAAVTAALWVLKQLKGRKNTISGLNKKAEMFYKALRAEIKKEKISAQLNVAGSMFTIFFSKETVMDYASAKKCDTQKFARFFQACLKEGVYLAPSQFEANFISLAHTGSDLQKTLQVFVRAFKA